jgi:hypothetical protein
MFGFGFALLAIIPLVHFGLGCMKFDIPYDLLEVPRSRIRLVAGQGRMGASSGWVLSQRAHREQTERGM